MELEFLGTSSAVPSKQRNHTSISLKAFGEVMLFDCGEGTQRQLTNAHISPMKINKIFITHFHGDHILGLPGLIQSMGFRGRENPLDIYGPKGLETLINTIQHIGYFIINYPINFHEIQEDGKIIELGKKPKNYEEIQGQYIGLIKISKNIVKKVIKFYEKLPKDKMYDNKDFNNMYMTSFIQLIIDNLNDVYPVYIDGGWLEIDTIEDRNMYESKEKLFWFIL